MATDVSSLASSLASDLDDEALLRGDACRAYAIAGQTPPLVARPATVEAVAHVLATANRAGAAVTPWGGGTQQAIGRPPDRLEIVLSLERLNRVLIYEPDDLTCSVEAGVTLGALRGLLAEHNQMLPLDAPLPERATIGGLIATNASGPRRHAYGTLRDQLIGIRVVYADGMIAKAGGMVVKNVSGYDMMKLHLGALGTVAVIVSANFKLLPRPASQATAVARFDDLAPALATVDALLASQLIPTAIDVFDAPAAAAIGLGGAGAALAVRCEGPAAAVARTTRDVLALAGERGGRDGRTLDQPASDDLWATAANLAQVADLASDEAVLKLAVVPTDVPAALESIATACTDAGLTALRTAQAGVGVVLARVRPAAGVDAGPALARVQAALVVRWRHATVLGCAPHLKPGLAIWGAEPSGLAVMKAIKQEYDPNRTLNPGRYVGGI
ncbi:MAG: FAD-binding oxidoreductase [Chloroflexi bacterium]|nr:FAD-binding oxidoreductase [Chloroflexota bacterium]